MMSAMNETAGNDTSSQLTGVADISTVISLCTIPIVILWAGLTVATKSSIWGASAVVGRAEKIAKGTGRFFGKWGTYGIPLSAVRATGIPGGAQQFAKNFQKNGKIFGKKLLFGYGGSAGRESRESQFSGVFSGGGSGWSSARRGNERKKISEKQSENKDRTTGDVVRDLASKDRATRIAAARSLADDKNAINTPERLVQVAKAIEHSPEDLKYILGKADKDAIKKLDTSQLIALQKTIKNVDTKKDSGFEGPKDPANLDGTSALEIELEKINTTLNKRMISDGNALTQLNFQNFSTINQRAILDDLTGEDISKQKDDFFKDPRVKAYLKSLRTSADNEDKSRYQQFINRSNGTQRSIIDS